MDTKFIQEKFKSLFKTEGNLYTSPGRINLIGEHTDYNGGFVLPGSIDKAMYCEIKSNGTSTIRAYALDLEEYVEFGLGENDLPTQSWAKYLYGVCREMIKRGAAIVGFDTVFAGDVPLGAGMSSSAALESCFGYALNDIYQLGFDRFELAKIGQATEHNYVGVKCGIMDQFASCFGKEGSLIRLDCRSLEYQYVLFHPEGYRLVLINTCVAHELASSAYNKRRQSCENVVAAIQRRHPSVKLLRDADWCMLKEVANEVTPEDYIRAEFVLEEIQRLLDVCVAMENNDYETVGKKMYETHIGLSRKYEVSCEELDFLNDIARTSGVTGSRVMGGGFGGCTINLIKNELYDGFIKRALESYEQKFKIKPQVYDVVIKAGARKLL
ncbi:MAG: galactokinase [Dysgonamonadaceae bacterium]|jgi:galactokinase|nr:galactokinase [Dysgonamonadaceae bacterium]